MIRTEKALKWGVTTGSCAALAAKAAALKLIEGKSVTCVDIPFPDGSRLKYAILAVSGDGVSASATVIKDAGDDPDVTDGAKIKVTLATNDSGAINFHAGTGVGTISRAGLAIVPGEAAINPGPRSMIRAALAEVCSGGFEVTVAVTAGEKLAEKTFNPRLGIVGGISILGTTGRVRPFSAPALRDALKCSLAVAVAAKIDQLVLVPGNMGNKAAQHCFAVRPDQIVDVSNEWGFMLAEVQKHSFKKLLVVGHPGKLAKLPRGQWQTHSAQSSSAVPYICELAEELFSQPLTQVNTVEELFMQRLNVRQRTQLGNRLAGEISHAIENNYPHLAPNTVVLINLKRQIIGQAGELSAWIKS